MTFAGNDLNAVAVPAGVTSIDPWAFTFQGSSLAAHMWTEVFLGSGASPSDNATFLSEIHKIWYAQLMTANHTNPGGLVDEANAITNMDFNSDGINDNISIGGRIIDPAPVTTIFVNASGVAIAPSIQYVGAQSSGDGINRFLVMDNQADVFNPGNYYRYGQTVTLAPQTINGYQIPAQQVKVLGSGTVVTFVYTQSGAVSSAVTLAPTGTNALIVLSLSGTLIVSSLVLVAVRRA